MQWLGEGHCQELNWRKTLHVTPSSLVKQLDALDDISESPSGHKAYDMVWPDVEPKFYQGWNNNAITCSLEHLTRVS